MVRLEKDLVGPNLTTSLTLFVRDPIGIVIPIGPNMFAWRLNAHLEGLLVAIHPSHALKGAGDATTFVMEKSLNIRPFELFRFFQVTCTAKFHPLFCRKTSVSDARKLSLFSVTRQGVQCIFPSESMPSHAGKRYSVFLSSKFDSASTGSPSK